MDGFFRNIILKASEGRGEAEDARPNEYSLFDFNPEEPLACLFHQAKTLAKMCGVSCALHPNVKLITSTNKTVPLRLN